MSDQHYRFPCLRHGLRNINYVWQILGLDPALASESFKAIDTNGDGDISLDEFV